MDISNNLISSNIYDDDDKKNNLIVTKKEIIDDFDDEIQHWHNLIIEGSKKLVRCAANNKTLGAARIIPTYTSIDSNSVSKYYVLVEKLVDDFFETDKNHVFVTSNEKFCSLNIPVEKAFREPREMSRRSKIDWESRYFLKSDALRKIWCRILGHYVDWASHIPELCKMDQSDQLTMMIHRALPCIWLLLANRSIVYNVDGISLSGGSYFPRNEKDQEGVDKDILPFLQKMCSWVCEEVIDPSKEMDVTQDEYAILRCVLFFMPVSKLSSEGKNIAKKARNFYRNVLIQVVRNKFPHFDHFKVADRVSQLMAFLPVMETAARIEDEWLSVMTLFNVAKMQGELTYEIHVRKTQ